MSTPYTPPNFDGVVGHSGSAYIFPVKLHGNSDPDLCAAVNALFFEDLNQWPTVAAGGSAYLIDTTLVDCPDANEVVNWLAVTNSPAEFPGIPTPPLPNVASDDAPGTVPYVNPATSSSPDAIYALNYILDHDPFVMKG